MSAHPVSLADIRLAQVALADVVMLTPVLENPDVNEMLGGRSLLKAENFQRTGAFKIRGAYYRILNLTSKERACGTVSYSSGNHALGLARAAQLLGSCTVIVILSDLPTEKMNATRALGAEIVTFDRDTENSADVLARIISQTGRIEVPPSAHNQVLEGGGTAALELFEDAPVLDSVLVPCGGGGLTAATAVVTVEAPPQTQVYSAEPALFDDTCRSLAAGERLTNPVGQRTICDAIMTPMPNEVTFPINLDLLASGVTASDADVQDAMRFAFEHFKIVTEPGAVVGMVAVLNGQIAIRNRNVATIIIGSNVDLARFTTLTGDVE